MVVIRLRREGAKNSPYYKVVVADQRCPRDGKFLEIIGNYDPKKAGLNANIDLTRVDYWVKNGAQPSAVNVCISADYFRALQLGKVSQVAPVDKLSVAIAIGLSVVFLGEKLTWHTGLGAATIIGGTLVLIFQVS